MKKHAYWISSLCLGLGILPAMVLAQQETPTTEVRTRMDVPAPLGGLTPQLTPPPEGESGTVLMGGLGVNARYEDNVSSLNGSRSGRYLYSVIPRIGLQRLGQQTQWVFDYSGGVTFDQSAFQDELVTHKATADIRHDFSRRLAAEVREEYVVTSNPFARTDTSNSLPVLTGPGELSTFVVPSTASQTASISMASLSYQLGRRTGMGINGNFSLQRFRDVITTSGVSGGLIDTRAIAGRAFVVSQVSPHHKIGAEYQLQDMVFAGGLARTVDHTLFFFDEIPLRSDVKLSLFAGPDRSHLHNVLILNPNLSVSVVPALVDQWSWAGGTMLTWQGKRSGFRASARRGVSDGGGFLGAVRLITADLGLTTRIAAHSTAFLGTSYSDGRALDASANGTGERVTTAEGHVGIEHRIVRDLFLRGQYAHVYQPHGDAFVQNILGHRNRVELGLEYQFHRTLAQ